MQKEPYDWAKERIKKLVDKIDNIKTDDLMTSPGQIWSIKKLLALDYYIASTHVIFKKYFKKWVYVDTHSGSGLIGFNDKVLKLERFPGSALIATLRNDYKPFTDYLIADKNENTIKTLDKRLKKLHHMVGGRNYSPQIQNFEQSVKQISEQVQWGKAFLIFVDPIGYKDLEWRLVKQLLEIKTADVFLTFMSYRLAINKTNANPGTKYEKTFDRVFGTREWRDKNGQNELVELYMNQLRTKKNFVYTIPIFKTGEKKIYDLIFATNSTGAGRIMKYISELMEVVSTELIESALHVVANKKTEITDFF